MSSPADRTVAHITFKRDRKSGSYVPGTSSPPPLPLLEPAYPKHRQILPLPLPLPRLPGPFKAKAQQRPGRHCNGERSPHARFTPCRVL
ncbi:hypothetical protein CALVIDRAFT_539505 [Calocera viscosa TUFC12733]|uniref:Uncharacterized protein n=1 Tax=Calocera viscosa (strain TUFC12733) TaxID=1330018 RepID=A0A167JSA1_CALVF|nr:hypothetical protein CALVIDRAFT_539505 [Calocera viscosa TUFC12733]